MTALVLTCLLGFATPVAAPQGAPPPPPSVQQPASFGQGQQGQQGQAQQGQQGQQGQGQGPTQTPQGRRGTPAPTAAAPEAPTAKPSPAHYDSASLQNVRVEVTLTDTLSPEGPSKKSVSMIVVDNNSGQIRSQGPGSISLNVDVMPHLRPDGKIYLSVNLYYLPEPVTTGSGPTRSGATLNEGVSVIVVDGKPMVISQSADPRGDRKVTVEVTATVVK